MGVVSAVEFPLYYGIVVSGELLAVGITCPGDTINSAQEFTVSDTEDGNALYEQHQITLQQYQEVKDAVYPDGMGWECP